VPFLPPIQQDQYPATGDTQCIEVIIPDGDEFKALLAGLIALASNVQNYQDPESAQADGLAAIWDEAYSLIDWEGCKVIDGMPQIDLFTINAIPLAGAAIAAAVTALIVVSCLAAPVALFAVADSGDYAIFLGAMSDDPREALAAPTDIKAGILYLLDASFPVNTGLTAIIEYFIIKKAGTIIATGVMMLIRALPI